MLLRPAYLLFSTTFLLQCVADLRARLRERGSELLVRVGPPERVLRQLCERVGAACVYAHAGCTSEELATARRVRGALDGCGTAFRSVWGGTLHALEDLPLSSMPSNYGSFRARLAAIAPRAALPAPAQLRRTPLGCPEAGELPTASELGVAEPETPAAPMGGDEGDGACRGEQRARSPHAPPPMCGGESEALRRLAAFAAAERGQGGGACNGGLYGANFSVQASPWLALGCLSPRRLYQEMRDSHAHAPKDQAATHVNWLAFEVRL